MAHHDLLGAQERCSPLDPIQLEITAVVGLSALVASAREAIETVDFATLMASSSDHLRTVGDTLVREIEELQYAWNDGPAFDALRTRRICRIVSTTSSPCRPALREACRRHGIMSLACLPIIVNDVVLATLNLYSRDYHAFGPAETRTALRLAEQASRLIASSMSSART